MAQKLYGSINFTKLMDAAKSKHSSFSRSKSGDVYCNFDAWINDTPDKYGNDVSLQLKTEKGSKDKIYFGNAKINKQNTEKGEDREFVGETEMPF